MVKSKAVRLVLGEEFDAPSWTTHSFSLHGLGLKITSNSPSILNSIMNLLKYFHSPQKALNTDIHFYLMQYPLLKFHLLPLIRKEGRLLFDSEKDDEAAFSQEIRVAIKYYSWNEYYVADFGPQGVFFLDIFGGVGIGFFPDPDSIHPRILSNFIFLIGFSEILRSKDLYLVHAAALSKEGKGVLIPGFTGSGKTTLCISLLSGGFKFLSDDRPFLRRDKEGFKLLAFPEGLDVTEQTISFFPDLKNGPYDLFEAGPKKKTFRVERVYPNSVTDVCRPRVLLFPKKIEGETSRLNPLSKVEAVEILLPHSLLVFDHEISERHFHLLCQVVEEMDCYQLDFGRDFLKVHQLIEKVL